MSDKKKPYVPSLYPENPQTAKFKKMSEDSMRRILDRHGRRVV